MKHTKILIALLAVMLAGAAKADVWRFWQSKDTQPGSGGAAWHKWEVSHKSTIYRVGYMFMVWDKKNQTYRIGVDATFPFFANRAAPMLDYGTPSPDYAAPMNDIGALDEGEKMVGVANVVEQSEYMLVQTGSEQIYPTQPTYYTQVIQYDVLGYPHTTVFVDVYTYGTIYKYWAPFNTGAVAGQLFQVPRPYPNMGPADVSGYCIGCSQTTTVYP